MGEVLLTDDQGVARRDSRVPQNLPPPLERKDDPASMEGSAIGELRGQMQTLVDDMGWVKENMRVILQKLDEGTAGEISPDNYDMTASQIRGLILEKMGPGKPFYPSDLAMEYGLDFDAVLEAVGMLREEGRIVVS